MNKVPPSTWETMEERLAADLVQHGFTMEARPHPLDKNRRRILISAPGKTGRYCEYDTTAPGISIRAVYKTMIWAAQQALPKDRAPA